ncbi:hypothetical protein PC9H_003921 [Pleurotus ostreatus]|uniref:DinB-like domain-containing protein n=1 Tax=Pleurotus ostreatus TaxID=5322 RepID=A0A8H7A2U6_PLEOS|nr:uncharacterized protein PC9H_003921 [Pleurotus ostreatus]KAF7437087.1 hypothetical protein PC9H_003921 [Pleurotus ostreatus]KAJ8702933.1 hypothetical protein PTI98_001605 [Pleurotus ostreatus]
MIAALQTETTTMAPNGNANGNTEHELQSQQLLAVARTVLEQAVDLVDNYLTSDDQLTVHSKSLPGSTIGKHLRHARDHFILLVESVSSEYVLNYDVRSRNTPMESSLSEARVALIDAITRLEKVVPQVDIHQRMALNAITPYPQTLETTFGRELWFAALHCIHHWSMVRVIAGELDITLTDDFGFAPSTLVHQGKEAPLGKAKI